MAAVAGVIAGICIAAEAQGITAMAHRTTPAAMATVPAWGSISAATGMGIVTIAITVITAKDRTNI